MSDSSKRDPLLSNVNKNTVRRRGSVYGRNEEWWTEQSGSSSSSSQCSSQAGHGKADWENYVNTQGELFYVESYSQKTQSSPCMNYSHASKNASKEDNSEKENSAGILVRLIRRRNSRRSIRRKEEESLKNKSKFKTYDNESQDNPSVLIVDNDECYLNEVTIKIDPRNSSCNLGRRATALENLFGLVTISDDSCLIVSGFISGFEVIYEGKIKIGDCLHSIDGIIINADNIDSYLSTITTVRDVILKVRSVDDGRYFEVSEDLIHSTDQAKDLPGFGVVYAKLDNIVDGGPPGQGIIYSFPQSEHYLSSARGAFFTLHQLLPDVLSVHPISTTIEINGNHYHVLYSNEGKEILLLSLPNSRYSLKEAVRINDNVVRCLCFMFQSLSKCFSVESNKDAIDDFFKKMLKNIDNKLVLDDGASFSYEFEEVLPEPKWLPLPKEAQMHIDDALNELESNDINAYENQRLYTVIGSAFYFKGFMICSHLTKEDLIDVSSLCKHLGLTNLCRNGVQELIFWKEVYPSSCLRGFKSYSLQPYSTPHGRWFILIIGKGHDMLAVLLESGGCTERLTVNPGPDLLYVEEAQATLDHIRKLGIPRFATSWLEMNSRPEKVNSEFPNLIDASVPENSTSLLSPQSKSQDATIGSKARNSRGSPLFTVNCETEDTFNQAGGSYIFETGPVLGRRAERERATETNSQSRVSESEVSDDSDWMKDRRNSDSTNTLDMSDFSRSLLPELTNISRLTSGAENVLFHYVHVDRTEGVILSSVTPDYISSNMANILNNFKCYSHHIHSVLMNTVSFKKIKSQEMSNPVNKSLVAIKEYGILFETNTDERSVPIVYWMIGRLFFVPHPREVYVCFQDSCPQNMVEIAFRLALSVSS